MNTKTGALVSVVIPTFNSAQYVGAAVDTVLEQTYPHIEILIVDDGSTDDTRERLDPVAGRIQYIAQENLGAGAARNAGVERARGDYLTFLDADDLFARDKIERQVDALNASQDLDMVFGHLEEFFSDELTDEERRRLVLRPGHHPAYTAQAMLIRRTSFDRVGPFDRWQNGEFIDWYLRAIDAGLTALMLQGIVVRRRLHRTNVGIRHRDARGDFARILKASMDRRRKAAAQASPLI